MFLFFRSLRRKRARRRAPDTAAYRARREDARTFVHARLAYWRSIHPFEHGQVRIKNHRGAWGSCSSKKNLNFNWRLVTLPPELADYVVLHELVHTIHLNHSNAFWGLLTTMEPMAQEYRARLRRLSLQHFTEI